MNNSNERKKQLIFIISASGSGTTMLTRVLSTPSYCVSLGGNYVSISQEDKEGINLAKELNRLTAMLWDRQATFEEVGEAKENTKLLFNKINNRKEFSDISHVIYKRSAPFKLGDRYRPDILDVFSFDINPKVVFIYRDPRSSSYSSFRRGFAENLRQCAVICEEQLTYLSSQIEKLKPHEKYIINYEYFCHHPLKIVKELAEFCEMSENDLKKAVDSEQIDTQKINKWSEELSKSEVGYLNDFFSPSRLAQWHNLKCEYSKQ